MGLAGFGVFFNLTVTWLVVMSGDYPDWLALGMGACGLLSLLGLFAAAAGAKQMGGLMVIVGAAPFLPLGFVAMWGGRQLVDESKDLAFEGGGLWD
jgi:hypothetical protein